MEEIDKNFGDTLDYLSKLRKRGPQMQKRTTRKDLERRLKLIQNLLNNRRTMSIDYSGQPVRPRLYITNPSGGTQDIGPRLPMKEMALFMDALIEGMDLILKTLGLDGGSRVEF